MMKKAFIGQEKIKNLFETALKKDTLNHCYAIEGEKGMGKSTLTQLLAQMIVCENHNACGYCKDCVMAQAGTHPDIEYILPEEDKKKIGVDVVRKMIADIYVRPYTSEKKVIVINDFEIAMPQAQNAILKVLEEPPEYVVFLLTVSSVKDMLDTVKSRSTILTMQPYSGEEIKQFLRENTLISDKEIDFIAAYSNGNTGKGKRLAENEEFSALRRTTFERLFELALNRNIIPISDMAKKDSSGLTKEFFECILSFFRDMLMYKIGAKALVVNADYADRIMAAAEKIKTERIIRVMQDILAADENLQRNINYNLAVMSMVFGGLEEING
ncbi:MAG: DNA polymerase III subunit delta' C-terminal domain-containing protein [Bacillota bacterium]|nr:DNA polymerase III subunit delta' C-terminal domain-containing protein [Bacillota bacterium]